MKKENRFAAFIRGLIARSSRREDRTSMSIASCMNAMIDEPNNELEAEFESFRSEYLYG